MQPYICPLPPKPISTRFHLDSRYQYLTLSSYIVGYWRLRIIYQLRLLVPCTNYSGCLSKTNRPSTIRWETILRRPNLALHRHMYSNFADIYSTSYSAQRYNVMRRRPCSRIDMDGQKWIHYRPTKIPCYLETPCSSTFYERSTPRFLS
jgi:hypothetical protein